MHFFRRFTRRTTVPHPDQPSPEGPHFPENKNIGLPEAKHPYFYPENTALSCKEVRGFQFPKKPPHRRHPTDYPPQKKHTKASPTETLHTTNLTPRPPKTHLPTLKNHTKHTPKASSSDTKRKYFENNSQNVWQIHAHNLPLHHPTEQRPIFQLHGKHPPKTGSSGKSGVNRKEKKQDDRQGRSNAQPGPRQTETGTAKQQQP